jgi:HPt (histidine-containing phosphotransfer) domain-containing protein
MPARIEEMEKVCEEQKYDELTRLIHSLSGAASSIAAQKLAYIVQNLEQELRNGEFNNIKEKIEVYTKRICRIEIHIRNTSNGMKSRQRIQNRILFSDT